MNEERNVASVRPPSSYAVSPSAAGWALAVEAAFRVVPRAELRAQARISLSAVAWALAAAADHSNRVPPELSGADDLARAAGVGDRVWQKRSAWLRENGWLRRGPGGPRDGWVLCSPA